MKARIAITVLALLSLCSVVSTIRITNDHATAVLFGGGGIPTPCQLPPVAAGKDDNCPLPPALAK